MLTATPGAVGPTTYVAINGMLSTAPPPTPQLSNSSGPMLAIPSSITSPAGVVGAPNGTTGPFILPPTYPSLPPNLCNLPFPPLPFQTTPFFPFLTPTATGLLSNTQGTTPLSLGSPFGTPLPTFISTQPQSLASSMAAFPSSISTNPLISPIIASTTPILPLETNQLSTSNSIPCSIQQSLLLPSFPIALSQHPPSSSIVTSTPELLLPLPYLGLPTLSTSCANEPLSVVSGTQQHSTTPAMFTTASGLLTPAPPQASTATTTVIMTPITFSVVNGTCTNTATPTSMSMNSPEVVTTTVNSSYCPKMDKPPPIAPITISLTSTTPVNSTDGSPLGLESVGYHRDAILDAIDKLRERKARPDLERIACMLKRNLNINPDLTQVCLGHLADSGAIVCVDYKGNVSYRNPSKWRKNTAGSNSGLGNPPNISQRLVEAVRRVLSTCNTVNAANNIIISNTEGGHVTSDTGEVCSSPAPIVSSSIGCTTLQIEQALQQMDTSAVGEALPSGNIACELTGSALRIFLDREATSGKLAKTSNGRYVLDESGERKKLANINIQSTTSGSLSSPMLMTKKLLPPQSASAIYLPLNSSVPKFNRPFSSNPMIAPAGGDYSTNRLHPLAAKQLPSGGSVNIAPNGSRPLAFPSISARPFNSSGRRGRPPGTKIRKGSILPDTTVPPEKKSRLDSAAGVPTSGSGGVGMTVGGIAVPVATLTSCFETSTITSFPVQSISTSSPASVANHKAVPVTGPLISAPQIPSVLPASLGAGGPTVFQTSSLPMPNGTACTAPFLTNLLPGPTAPGLCPTLLPNTPMLTAPFTVTHPASMSGLPPGPLTSATLGSAVVPTASVSPATSSTSDLCNFSASLTGHFLTLPTSSGGLGMPTFLSTVSCNPAIQPDVSQCPLKLISPVLASSSSSLLPSSVLTMQNQTSSTDTSGLDLVPNVDVSTTGQSKLELPDPADLCSTCAKPSTVDEPFLICSSCKLMAHPTCLGYWPQFTQRARQSTWQCTDCKSCNICQQKKSTSDLLICDACDGGFHSECLPLALQGALDSSQLWLCTDCQKAGYSVTSNGAPDAEDSLQSSPITAVVTVKQDELDEETLPKAVLDTTKADDSEGEEKIEQEDGRLESQDEVVCQSKDTATSGKEYMGTTTAATASPRSLHSPSSSGFRDLSIGEGDCLAFTDKSAAKGEVQVPSQLKKPAATPSSVGDAEMAATRSNVSPTNGFSQVVSLRPEDVKSDEPSTPLSVVASTISSFPETTSSTKWDGNVGAEASRPADIRAWSMEEVHDWLLFEGFPREAEAFQQQEIDGACLLLMKRMDVLTELGIKLGPAVKIYERIKRLQARCTSPSFSFLTPT